MFKIYKITNLATDEGYIGYSKHATDRIREHMNHCKKNGSQLLRTAIRIFGEENFTSAIIDEAETKSEAIRKKREYILKFRTGMPTGYNQKPGGAYEHKTKLTENDMVKILSDDRLQKVIAKDYGVSEATVSKIKRGKGWKHLGG